MRSPFKPRTIKLSLAVDVLTGPAIAFTADVIMESALLALVRRGVDGLPNDPCVLLLRTGYEYSPRRSVEVLFVDAHVHAEPQSREHHVADALKRHDVPVAVCPSGGAEEVRPRQPYAPCGVFCRLFRCPLSLAREGQPFHHYQCRSLFHVLPVVSSLYV